ncbi:MAG: flavin reductase [Anaeromicrobium sp.]|jgi:flavin reductase (DIM6/NTAB) family NADH-FMN oxidoreductase RutF|uniref:flavin reductase family protein n=1 Tax=Anaeromicrobium sp. TaxID=1929132 RepID=UPI0025D2C714|nr:flavin reductase [Anaeromicrobium sp.]MCT4595847.1 flavin reductase [Anaeromicrobium sp.]
MIKKDFEFPNYTTEMLQILKEGRVLLVGKDKNGKSNPMTIAWGSIMYAWNRPLFVAMVRSSRYTYKHMEENNDFTVNFLSKDYKDALGFCGSKSGRDFDKWKETGLTPGDGRFVNGTVIDEAFINMECRTVYKDEMDLSTLEESIRNLKYDKDKNDQNVEHTFYFGEIMGMYGHME